MATAAEYLKLIIASEFKAKAFQQAEKATTKLEKNVKKLGKTLGLSLGSAAVVAAGKTFVKAFAEDEAAVKNLSNTVKNLGLAFADADIQSFIDSLTLASSVADSKLRPAFAKLLTTTGSVIKSEAMLKQAIDISRGSGVELETVASDLANAYVGNTKGLKKYALGLTQAELKTMSFAQVMDTFMGKFKGANQQYLNTTAGKLELIKNNAAEAAETIGKGLVDGFKILAGDQEGLGKVADIIQKIATNTADFFRGLAQGFKDLANMPVIKQLMQLAGLMLKIVYKTAGAFIDPFIKEGARSRSSALAPSSANEHLKALQAKINADKAAKAEKDAAKRQRELIKFQKDAAKQALKEKKLGYIFDMDQIQVIAALQKTKDEETRKRLELQLALLQGQTDEAQRLAGELAKIEGKNSQLALFLRTLPDAKNPFASWSDYLAALEKEAVASAKRIADAYANANKPNPSNPSSPASPSFIGPLPIGATAPAVPSFTVPLPAGTNIYDFNTGKEITVNLNVTTDAGQQIDVNQSYTADGGALTVRRNNPSWSLGTN